MSHHNALPFAPTERGFTIVELAVVLVLTSVIALAFYTFFNSNLFLYLHLQSDASNFTDAAAQSQRISSVVRGLTDITTAKDSELQVYAYFFPADAYVSQVRYYLNGSSDKLLADVTSMTANPPSGSLITASKKTYTIVDNFKLSGTTKLFVYLDGSNNALTTPVSDLAAIKAIQINLTVAASSNTNQVVSTQVSLRNRKTNL